MLESALVESTSRVIFIKWSMMLNRIFSKKTELNTDEVDLIRDSALLLEKHDVKKALELMSLARKHRPQGSFIAAKCTEYSKEISNWCFSIDQENLIYRNKYQLSNPADSSSEKYIISGDINNIYSGLGCMLLVLGPAWKYAKSLGRTLVVDWRNSPYVRSDSSLNLFSRLFDPAALATTGVKVIADDRVNTISFPNSLLLSKMEVEHESGIRISCNNRGIGDDDVIELLQKGVGVDAKTFIPSLRATYRTATRYSPLNESESSYCSCGEAACLYQNLKPIAHIQQQIDSYSEEYFCGEPVIGIHVRHGNGEEHVRAHFSGRVITEFEDFIDNLLVKIDRIAKAHQFDGYKIFLCTDSAQVVSTMRERVPHLLTRNIWRPEKDKGVDFDHPFDTSEEGIDTAVNALIDMQLLGLCNVAVLTKPTSFGCQVPYLQMKSGATFLTSEEFNQI
jgi:hypothetical protein